MSEDTGAVHDARDTLVSTVLALLLVENGDDRQEDWATDVQYRYDQIYLAAAELTEALQERAPSMKPTGWKTGAARRRALAHLALRRFQ